MVMASSPPYEAALKRFVHVLGRFAFVSQIAVSKRIHNGYSLAQADHDAVDDGFNTHSLLLGYGMITLFAGLLIMVE